MKGVEMNTNVHLADVRSLSTDSDRDLLELAAKAAGVVGHFANDAPDAPIFFDNPDTPGVWESWNPLTDDGDALRLAVKLRLEVCVLDGQVRVDTTAYSPDNSWRCFIELFGIENAPAATRRAIVRAAAEMGRQA